MPLLTRTYLKTSLIYFFFALLLALLLASGQVANLPESIAVLRPIYLHLFVVGWISQIIFGMMYWMLPKLTKENPRGNIWLAWATYGLINLGLIMRLVTEPLHALRPSTLWGTLLALSGVLQWLGGILLIATMWKRVKYR